MNAFDPLFAPLRDAIAAMKPAIEASLDPVAVVDTRGQLVFCNGAMRSFLSLKNRELAKHPVFCDLVKLSACEGDCQVLASIRGASALRLDEIPATKVKDKEKLRLSLRVVPLRSSENSVIGAALSLRDSTAEIVLQAKYHKLLEIVSERNEKIRELDETIKMLRSTLRKARVSSIT